jgi:hypothetical protein
MGIQYDPSITALLEVLDIKYPGCIISHTWQNGYAEPSTIMKIRAADGEMFYGISHFTIKDRDANTICKLQIFTTNS